MRLRRTLILLSLSLAVVCSMSCQNAAAKNDYGQARPIDNDIEGQRAIDFRLGMVYSNYPVHDVEWLKSHGWRDEQIRNAIFMIMLNESSNEWHRVTNLYHTAHFDIYHIGSSNIFVPTAPNNEFETGVMITNFPPEDVEWLKSHGWHDEQIKNAISIFTLFVSSNEWHQVTNSYRTALFDVYQIGSSNVLVPATSENGFAAVVFVTDVPETARAELSKNKQQPAQASNDQQQSLNPNLSAADIAALRSQGFSDWQIANASYTSNSTPSLATSTTPSDTPPDLQGAIIYMDSFLGMANQTVAGDVVSMRSQALKFRLMGKDYDYSGNYTVVLNTPRQHSNPYFGLGSPETASVLVLEDVNGQTYPLPNATIWEKEANFIDAVSCGKEWIYSGTYSIQSQ